MDQGIPRGSCLTEKKDGSEGLACDVTLKQEKSEYHRLIKSLLLSRPEDYLSIYQSGCNHSCLKCHSHEFSKVVAGDWMSTDQIAQVAEEYREYVTVFEPREAATSWHAHRLCRHCGSCVLYGKPSANCPKKLQPDQVVSSPQGFGPARNIVAFTGGDILCQPDFYVEAAQKIKQHSNDLWVLLETNGYGLTKQNLDTFAKGSIDSFWLDIKAYSRDVYKRLCGTENAHILESVEEIISREFSLEILTLYIPGLVETDEHVKIAKLIADVDSSIPTTLLAFFPCYKLDVPEYRPPTLEEMATSYIAMKNEGVENLRLGNLGIFIQNDNDMELLHDMLGSGF